MRKALVLIVLVGLFPLLVIAQTPKAEIFGGYQYAHVAIDAPGTSVSGNLNGWNTSLTGNINEYFGIAGDFSGDYGKIEGVTTHVYTYGGGPVINLNHNGTFNPFVHALFGGAHLSLSEAGDNLSFNGFTMMVGGGADAKLGPHVAVRLFQADWVYFHFGDDFKTLVGTSNLKKNVRVSTGIVFRF
jgi:hypothetical protein